MKALVVYYSLEGNTALIADTIRETLMIPAMRIQPVKELSSTGFRKYVWGGSQVIMGFKPKLEPIAVDFQEFDVIFLGSPIWAGTFAPPIKTLLEEGYFTNKKVYYFYTHEGGSLGAPRRAKASISKHNRFITSKGFIFVLKNKQKNRKKAQEWALECAQQVR